MTIYTIEDLVPMMRLSKKALRSYLADGRLIGRKVGKRWLVTEDAVKAFLMNANRMTTATLPTGDNSVSGVCSGCSGHNSG